MTCPIDQSLFACQRIDIRVVKLFTRFGVMLLCEHKVSCVICFRVRKPTNPRNLNSEYSLTIMERTEVARKVSTSKVYFQRPESFI